MGGCADAVDGESGLEAQFTQKGAHGHACGQRDGQGMHTANPGHAVCGLSRERLVTMPLATLCVQVACVQTWSHVSGQRSGTREPVGPRSEHKVSTYRVRQGHAREPLLHDKGREGCTTVSVDTT